MIFEKNYKNDVEKPKTLTQELKIYKNEGEKGPILKKILSSLQGQICHSVNNERGFSSLSNIFCQNRTRLSDKSILALNFLNWYYKKYEDIKKSYEKEK